MNGMIQPFAAEDMEALALFAERLNAQRESGSTFCCARAEDIRRDFEEAMEYGFAYWMDGKPVGLVNCFPDVEKGNADCSLLVDVSGEAYQEIAGKLLSVVREKLGPGMVLTFFFPTENKECRSFLDDAGARQQENEYILRLEQEDWNEHQDLEVELRPIQSEERDAFAACHDTVFPGVYASGKDILEDLGKTRFVYVVPDRAGLTAYGVLKTCGGKQATVEMIGVREDSRRCGYGRAVLNHLAGQAFSRFGAEQLELVVDADNQSALHLYLDTGFKVWQENNCYILR